MSPYTPEWTLQRRRNTWEDVTDPDGQPLTATSVEDARALHTHYINRADGEVYRVERTK